MFRFPFHPRPRIIAFAAGILAIATLAFVVSPTRPHAVRADANIDVGANDSTLMAGITVGEPSSDELNGCVWHTTVISKPDYEPYSFIKRNGVTYRWYARVCRTRLTGEGSDITFHWIPVVSESTMASQATKYAFGLIPVPLVGTSPPAHRGVVNLPMWWWVSPSTWRTVSVTVWLPTPRGPLIVRATATPVKLHVNPADDSARNKGRFTCEGPGREWHESDGDAAKSRCMYLYSHAIRAGKASVSIEWAISWKSNWGKSGKLPNRSTTRQITVSVGEIQALVTE